MAKHGAETPAAYCRLILAAPDLLAACEAALSAMRHARDTWGDGYQPDPEWCAAWDDLKAAIAKTHGEVTRG